MDIEQVKELISKNKIEQLGRSQKGIEIYQKWKNNITREYLSVVDYMKHILFGYDITRTEDGLLMVNPPEERHNRLSIILKQNDFPYHLADNLIHYCLWSNQELENDFVSEYVRKTFDEYIWFINPVGKKSIAEIYHIHIFVIK